jgi:hypothetical protein
MCYDFSTTKEIGPDGSMDIEALREMFYRENQLKLTRAMRQFLHIAMRLANRYATHQLDMLSFVYAEMEAKRDLRTLASVSTGGAKVRRDSFWE